MELRKGEYRIEDDGIWIKKEVLESWRDHYADVSLGQDRLGKLLYAWFYMGKRDVCVDLLKMFEPLEGL